MANKNKEGISTLNEKERMLLDLFAKNNRNADTKVKAITEAFTQKATINMKATAALQNKIFFHRFSLQFKYPKKQMVKKKNIEL